MDEKERKKRTLILLAIALVTYFLIYYFRFSHGKEWYIDFLSHDLHAANILTLNMVFGAALWGFGRLVKGKKAVKKIIIGLGVFNLVGSILCLVCLFLSLFIPSARDYLHFYV